MEYKKLLEQHGGLGFEKQNSLFEIIGDSDWGVDLDTGILSFSNGEKFEIQILGSYGYNAESWLWEWANIENDTPKKVLQDALKLKEWGEENSSELLTTPEFKCNTTEIHFIGIIASSILGSSAYYCGDYGQGIALMTISSKKIDELEYNEEARIANTFPSLISLCEMNHKEAFSNYLVGKGYSLKEENNTITASKEHKLMTAAFDELNRLKDLNTTIK